MISINQAIEISTNVKRYGLNLNQAVYPNKNGKYSPIVLEIEQIRERGLWGNDPLITVEDETNKAKYKKFFDKLYGIQLLAKWRLFEKRLYRWAWIGLIPRFYGDKAQYTLDFETRRITGMNVNLDTNEIQSIQTVWYFTNDSVEYQVIENWNKTQVQRRLIEATTKWEWDLEQWNTAHPNLTIQNWTHNYGVVPVLPVMNSMGEDGQAINGFANALTHINELDRLQEEIKYETIATRSKTYYDPDAFARTEMQDNKPIKVIPNEQSILDSTTVAVKFNSVQGLPRGENLNDAIKASAPIFVAQFDRNTIIPLLTQKEKLRTEIYTMLGFTDSTTTSVVQKTATEMEYYNENTASTLKNLSLDRTNTVRDFLTLIFKIGVNVGYSGFDSTMTVDDLVVKVIPNIKSDQTMYLNYQKAKYDFGLLTRVEFKEIIDETDKEAVDEWIKTNAYGLVRQEEVDVFDKIVNSGIVDKVTSLKILFNGALDDSELQVIADKADEEKPSNPLTDEFGDVVDEDNSNFNQ